MATDTFYPGESSDDCFRRLITDYFSLTHDAIAAGRYGSTYYDYGAGIRFTSVTIPAESVINSAYLKLYARNFTGNSLNEVRTRISADDTDDALTFSTSGDFDTRYAARTTARVDWDEIPDWTTDVQYTSPDIKTVIQEIIDRGGWASGNDIALFWEDFDTRSDNVSDGAQRQGVSYDHGSNIPELTVTWTAPVVAGGKNIASIMRTLGII